jgi:hypothetical protein
MADWKDGTSYSQGQRGVKAPTAWETTIGGMRIFITKAHRSYPGDWVMNCRDIDLNEFKIGDESASEISMKRAAIDICGRRIREKIAGLEKAYTALFNEKS